MTPSDSPSLRIEPVTTRSQREAFIEVPFRLLGDRQHWVPPLRRDVRRLLDPAIHPFHQHAEVALFLAYGNGSEPVGRIAAIRNHLHNEHHRDRVGFYGFFDAVDDVEVFRALLDHAAAWLAERACDTMRGPCSFSTNEECGLLVEGFERYPSILLSWTPPYYQARIEQLGARPSMDLLSYWMNREELSEKLFRLYDSAKKRLERQHRLSIRPVNLKRLHAELEIVQRLYNRSWSDNWGFVPMTTAEMAFMAKDLKPIVQPDLAIIVELDGAPAAFSLALPDYNIVLAHMNGSLGPTGLLKAVLLRKSIKSFRLLALGVDPDYRRKGLDLLLYAESARRGLDMGYRQAEFSWVLETNREMNRAMISIGAKVIRRHRFYEWPLDSAGKRIESAKDAEENPT